MERRRLRIRKETKKKKNPSGKAKRESSWRKERGSRKSRWTTTTKMICSVTGTGSLHVCFFNFSGLNGPRAEREKEGQTDRQTEAKTDR